ncbi:MAG: site-specific DNA-methyltransferase [Patescibacteria group bacterium]|nr:site-specific DNA-methyltransferase [Patescibacteria group bacterium]
MNKFIEEILNILKKDKRLFSKDDNKLLKGELISLISKDDEKLLELLASNKEIEKRFFKKIGKITIFQKENFLQLITMNEFLPDSFTAFEVNIGLSNNKKLISSQEDISLVFPHKDCILEGGQNKENTKREEIFYNTTLAPDEVDRLKEPKVLTNWKKFDSKGEHKITDVSLEDNLIIKGNNLMALYSLLPNYRNKIKLIYIDPPYNTGNDSFKYNDSFNHGTWLTFMKNRLEVARELLSDDGSIYMQLDHNEVHYGKVLMDEIFGRNNFQREIIWHKGNTFGYAASADNFVLAHDSILFYSKTSNKLFNKIYKSYSDEYIKKRFIHNDNDGKGPYRIQGKNQKQYLSDSKGLAMSDVWTIPVINVMAKEKLFDTQKPEALLQIIIEASTNKNDIVLDFMAGSGTTLAVAHKINRRYIGIEQMDYIHNLPEARLKRIIKGEQDGISKEVNWKGGGSFIYTELLEWNNKYIRDLESAKTKIDIKKIKAKIEKEAFYKYQIDTSKFDNKEFDKLSEKEQKEVLIDVLDMNHLYVNLDSINDATFAISKEDKELNKKFYNQK